MQEGLGELLEYGKRGRIQYYEAVGEIMDITGMAVTCLARRYNRGSGDHSEDWEDWWNEFYGEKLPMALLNYNKLSNIQAKSWICTTAARFFLDKIRKQKSRKWALSNNLDALFLGPSGQKTASNPEISSLMRVCINKLRQKGKEMIRLKFFENLSHAKIAENLRISEIASRQRLFRALDALKKCMMRGSSHETS